MLRPQKGSCERRVSWPGFPDPSESIDQIQEVDQNGKVHGLVVRFVNQMSDSVWCREHGGNSIA